jgi:glutamate decarboxylase
MQEALSKNFIDYEEYPRTAEIQNRCVNMIARMFNAPSEGDASGNAMGTSCIGSSEAILSFLAYSSYNECCNEMIFRAFPAL